MSRNHILENDIKNLCELKFVLGKFEMAENMCDFLRKYSKDSSFLNFHYLPRVTNKN